MSASEPREMPGSSMDPATPSASAAAPAAELRDRTVTDVRYRAFLRVVEEMRPRLHRHCARVTGSALDGEDVVQEALFEAFRALDRYDESRPMGPWLMRIAHRRSLDRLRYNRVRAHLGGAPVEGAEPAAGAARGEGEEVPDALAAMVASLAPKERAAVVLKEVLGYSLEDIAVLVDSTVGGVKAALHRGRSKLARLRDLEGEHVRVTSPEDLRVLALYVERFNRHDWDGVVALTRADARLSLWDVYEGPLSQAPGYFGQYAGMAPGWRFAVGLVDGVPAALRLRPQDGGWRPWSAVRLETGDGAIAHVLDYSHCGWLLASAHVVRLDARVSSASSPA